MTRSPRSTRTYGLAALALTLSASLAACSDDGTSVPKSASGDGEIAGSGGSTGGGALPSHGEGAASDSAAAGPSSGSTGVPSSGATRPSDGETPGATRPQTSPGILTAGAWDDNLNFARFLDYRKTITTSEPSSVLPFTDAEHSAAHDAFAGARTPKTRLDIALLVDTTGSMGDEIAYLKREFQNLTAAIAQKYPASSQRWSLVLYRDTTDDYIVRWFDFRTDLDDYRSKLGAQGAGGGGDFPEAPDQGFERMNALSWRQDADVARVAFWVADAPAHDANVGRLATALRGSRDRGVHVYPVASSGVDEPTELGMRSAAQITGGRYLFLTDDSGVGGAHKEPSIPCYFVTKLDQAILRMVDVELTGAYREPDASEVIRTGGNPVNRECSQFQGGTLTAF
ncbi:MAG: vWA domain-containing protein [Polyangiaceae bacterium]